MEMLPHMLNEQEYLVCWDYFLEIHSVHQLRCSLPINLKTMQDTLKALWDNIFSVIFFLFVFPYKTNSI